MGLFEGKTPAERNKTIAAIVLGVFAIGALYMAFGRGMFGGSTTTATSKATPTPSSKTTVKVDTTGGQPASNQFRLPTQDENALNMTIPVSYNPGNSSYGAPDPGRNIFAFYEPPPPTPYQTPSPTPPPPPPTPSPIPTPPFVITGLSPQSVYAGAKGGFKLEVYGERFAPNAKIYFNQTEMPTTFVSPQSLQTTVPENMVSQEGPKQVIVQTPDGMLRADAVNFTAMPPPRPTNLKYIGMVGRARYNNDTAYFTQSGNANPFGARLNDVVGSRFRVIQITAASVLVEDTSLGFKHRITMEPAATGTGGSGPPPPGGGFVPYNPGGNPQGFPGQVLPNVPRMAPGQGQPQPVRPAERKPSSPPNSKDDVDDNDPK